MKRLTIILFLCHIICLTTQAQRIQQALGRGVVAVQNNNNQVTVTWRRLAQEPESTRYNVYVNGTKINSSPLAFNNLQKAASVIPVGSSITVTCVIDGVEGEASIPFVRKSQNLRNIYMEISFEGGPLDNSTVSTKYCWPCDLDGNGEMDYVVDRNSTSSDRHYLEAYLADGTYLWTVDLGPNESSSSGQDDQICAYDIDCDGKGEVIVQTSDGTRFWNSTGRTWGLYVKGSTSGDTDGDGIIDYTSQTTKNPPKYMTVIDGLLGSEKNSVEQQYDDAYNRTNKASLMGDEYNKHVGHVGIFYPDGVHPALVMEWHTRNTSGGHMYRNSAFSYDYSSGTASNWHQLFMKPTGGATFHQIRIGDFDGDGCDEMSSGAYCMDQDGNTLYNTGIAHGDRHRTSDIDPERPGLETFSIQQDAGDMLGMILFDAGTGEPIKKWYLSGVGDVGRGECLDLDANHLGWEMFSTMNGYQVYDAKGDAIEGKTGYFPTEGIWWDGQLDRERVDSPDGDGLNADIRDYTNGRLIEMAKESGYTIKSSNAKRGKFWGDIIGDWREELILNRVTDGVNTGIVGFSTDLTTSVNNIYCLQQDPHYRGDCTTKGYYQSPCPGFYLGYNMPRPPLPPCMVADADNEVYGIANGTTTISPSSNAKNVYLMPVKGQTLTVGNTLNGTTNIWKSQQGTAVFSKDLTTSGTIYISEGTLLSAGVLNAPIQLRARGTLAGCPTVNDTIAFEGALNYEGCRLQPAGTMTFAKGLTLKNKVYIEMDNLAGEGEKDLIVVKGKLSVSGTPIFNIKTPTVLTPNTYPLMALQPGVEVDMTRFTVQGLTGLKYNLQIINDTICLVIDKQREASENVYWVGNESNTWDYQTCNWNLEGNATGFVAGDGLIFDESASAFTVNVPDLYPIGSVTIEGSKAFTFNGEGGFSGNGVLTKRGTGTLTLNCAKSDFTGGVSISEGTFTVKDLADTGTASALGSKGTISIGKGTLYVNNTSASTDRPIQVTDTATVQVPSGTLALKGIISGAGTFQKTGTGQININNNSNSWSGGTILKAGTLAMGAWDAKFGKTGSTIDVQGNSTITIFDSNSSSTTPDLSNVITISKGKTLTVNGGSRCKVSGTLKGQGTYAINFPYVRGDVYTNCSAFEGTYEVTSGQLRLRQAIDLSKATLKLDAGVYAAGYNGTSSEGSFTHKIGALSSTATDCSLNTGIWNVGYLGTDCSFAGVLASSGTLNKYGTDGTLTLTGTSAGNINVCEGILVLANTSAETTTGTVTIKSGATACGTGKAKAIIVQKGGTLKAGKAKGTTTGKLTLTGNLTVQSGGMLEFRTRVNATTGKCTNDALVVSGSTTLTSPTINIVNAYGDYATDQEFTLFPSTGNINITGTPTITPAQPAPGLLWDITDLAGQGILRVVTDPNYDSILSIKEAESRGNIFDLNGRKISHIQKEGIYIVDGKKVCVK